MSGQEERATTVIEGEEAEAEPITSEEAESAFDSGFDVPPTETPAATELTDEEKAAAKEADEAAAAELEASKPATLTKAELDELRASVTGINEVKASFEKQFGTAFGKIGGIERIINQLQQATPSGESVEITEEDFAELMEEYPDLGAQQLKGLQRVVGKLRGTGGGGGMTDDRLRENVAPLMEDAVVRAKAEIADETLGETHPDWREVVGSPDQDTEYRKWLNEQDQAYRDRVNNSYSPVVIGNSIDKFRAHQESQAAQKKSTTNARRNRFEGAITDKGDAGHQRTNASEEEDNFDAGFKSG